jgi:RecB family exonuclease
MPPRLPVAASPCEVPRFFAPSTWDRLERCPFSVWARGDSERLPNTPEAIIGTLLHAARKEILERGLVGEQRSDEVKSLLTSMVAAEEERLARSEQYRDIVPLAQVVGPRRWLEMTLELRLWARTASADFARRPQRPTRDVPVASPSPARPDDQDAFAYGMERAWTSVRCRLKGRPDEARLAADGVVEIIDYKSGDRLDSEGKLLPAVQTQLRLYMLMAEVLTNRPARGYVQGREVTEVAWGPRERSQIEERVTALVSRFAGATVVSGEAAAKAGRHCIGCRMRPTCTVYLRDVPQWWDNSGKHERPLPYDAWGVIAECKRDALGWSVMLDDVAGRRVLLRGISDRHGLEDLAAGELVFAFGLEPTEDTNVHGRRLHPRSFHERSPGPRWPDASQVRVYRG